MVRLMANRPLERSIAPQHSAIARDVAMPRAAPRRARMGVMAYQAAMEMRYHGADVNARMRLGVSAAPLTRASASWKASPSTANEMMRFTLSFPSR